ncbi:MAG: hypothetical protein EAZ64_08885 [Sphingobacteriales bacterium]|nr:MAG: hypothetical protein EAZ64_08885 [Sphingobacteriales bacterium]
MFFFRLIFTLRGYGTRVPAANRPVFFSLFYPAGLRQKKPFSLCGYVAPAANTTAKNQYHTHPKGKKTNADYLSTANPKGKKTNADYLNRKYLV